MTGDGSAAPSLELPNDTCKNLVQGIQQHCTKKCWDSGVRNPGAALRDVYEALGIVSVYSYRPTQKSAGEKTWIEQMLVIKSEFKEKYLHFSGKNGIFIKEWREKTADGSLAPSHYRMIWLGGDCDFNSAMVKINLLGKGHMGLVYGQSGFGVRVRAADYTRVGEFLMGEDGEHYSADDEFFEIAKVPVWVSSEDLLTRLNTHAKWATKLVREIHGSGRVKKFILRAKAAPEVDSVRIGDALLPIQKARPQQGGRVIFRVFAGGSQRERKGQSENLRRTKVTDDLAEAMDTI